MEALGIKEQESDFTVMLSRVTGIDQLCLTNPAVLPQKSVAIRMSWAANRETTRPEDSAYSLMGIFNINMPILYGEGLAGAFQRLQLEILQRTPDQSIFAWKDIAASENTRSGLLAPSPACFIDSRFTVKGKLEWTSTIKLTVATNLGIQINVPFQHNKDIFTASLRCWTITHHDSEEPERAQIILRRLKATSRGSPSNMYQRIRCNSLPLVGDKANVGERENIFVLNNEQADYAVLVGAVGSIPEMGPMKEKKTNWWRRYN
jgi:hypothetical protein